MDYLLCLTICIVLYQSQLALSISAEYTAPAFTWHLSNYSIITVYDTTHLYVNKYSSGTHEDGCGDWDTPCSTLFDVSKRIASQMTVYSVGYYPNVKIHIMNGQNETRLNHIIQHDLTSYQPKYSWKFKFHHPCLLYIEEDVAIQNLTIIFVAPTILNLNDWFPQSICNSNVGDYTNQYMFEADYANDVQHLAIQNLIVTDFATESLGIARKPWNYGSFTCRNCQFKNIVFKNTNAMFYTMAHVYLIGNTFEDIAIAYTVIQSGHYRDETVSDDTFRNIIIEQSRFFNVSSNDSLVVITQNHAKAYTDGSLSITETEFRDISAASYVVVDESWSTHIILSNIWMNIKTGSVYQSFHSIATDIIIHNMSLSTNAAFNEQTEALFAFAFSDTISMSNMNLSYVFDAADYLCFGSGLCSELGDISPYFNMFYDNKTMHEMSCENPTPFIQNLGHMIMNETSIVIEMQNEWQIRPDAWNARSCEHNDYMIYQFYFDAHSGWFILNRYIMEVYHLSVTRTVSRDFIHNEGDLIINDASFNTQKTNPNGLYSSAIISQLGGTVLVENSHFTRSDIHLYGKRGRFHISHSVLENAAHAVYIENSQSVLLHHTQVTDNGLYNGYVVSTQYENVTNITQGVVIFDTDDVTMRHNHFSGYDPRGLVHLSQITDIYLVNNTFSIHGDGLSYPEIDAKAIGFEYSYSPLLVDDSEKVAIINNSFTENFVDVSIPWLRLWKDDDVCITGNLFNNTAFDAGFTQITSCFRRQLSDCAVPNHLNKTRYDDCLHGLYGSMDMDLIDTKNVFVVAHDPEAETAEFIWGYRSNISLDNIDIVHNSSDFVFATLRDSILLLVDAYMDGMDVTSNDNHTYPCNVNFNDRLAYNTQYVTRFLMDCNHKNMTHFAIHTVDHSSVTSIDLVADTTQYYPGQLLTFSYHLSDRMGTTVTYDEFNTALHLIEQSSGEFIESLNIEHNECAQCDYGLFLNDIEMSYVDTTYTIMVQSEDILLVDNPIMNISIIGCPVGHSPDTKGFICQQCNTDYYNLSPNNTKQCMSCDPDMNQGIQCIQGQIQVSYNHWMGFDQESIVSAQCPLNYCCGNTSGCVFNMTHLCAPNRNDSSVLCGQCLDGYSESLRSTQCVLCDEAFYFEQMLFPLLLALLWAVGLILLSSTRTDTKTKKWRILEVVGIAKYLQNPSFIMMIRILFTRNIMYYEQALSQILSFSSNPFRTLCEMFNLSISRHESNDAFARCFIKGMNAKHKILMDFSMPIMVLLFIAIAHVLQLYFPLGLLTYRTCNFGKTYSAAFVLMVGSILGVLFRLMHCQSVGSLYVHYYFGNEICMQQTSIICLLCLSSIIAIFIVIMIQLKRIGHETRCDKRSAYYIFVDKYKRRCFWWEFVLFIRRICIAMFSASFTDDDSRFVFAVVLCVFLALQWKYEPFVVQSANQMECVLLMSVVLVIMMQTAEDMSDGLKSICVVVLVLLPFALFVYHIALFVLHKKRDDLSVSLLQRRLMYLIMGLMAYYNYRPNVKRKATQKVIYIDEDIDVMYDDEAVEMPNKQAKPLDKNEAGSSSGSHCELEEVVEEDSDVSISGGGSFSY